MTLNYVTSTLVVPETIADDSCASVYIWRDRGPASQGPRYWVASKDPRAADLRQQVINEILVGGDPDENLAEMARRMDQSLHWVPVWRVAPDAAEVT